MPNLACNVYEELNVQIRQHLSWNRARNRLLIALDINRLIVLRLSLNTWYLNNIKMNLCSYILINIISIHTMSAGVNQVMGIG